MSDAFDLLVYFWCLIDLLIYKNVLSYWRWWEGEANGDNNVEGGEFEYIRGIRSYFSSLLL